MTRSQIETLYRNSFCSLVTRATAVVHSRADAEDIVQNVFLSLLEGKADHLPPGPATDAAAKAEVTRLVLAAVSPPPVTVIPFVRPLPPRHERAA